MAVKITATHAVKQDYKIIAWVREKIISEQQKKNHIFMTKK